jgi:hypothetical protein
MDVYNFCKIRFSKCLTVSCEFGFKFQKSNNIKYILHKNLNLDRKTMQSLGLNPKLLTKKLQTKEVRFAASMAVWQKFLANKFFVF